MELVTIVRELWRRRYLVIASAIIALFVGLSIAFRLSPKPPFLSGRQYQVGTATAHILVDSPYSQTVDLSPTGSSDVDLPDRAALLGNLMGSASVSTSIAHADGLTPDKLVIVTPAMAGPPTPTQLALAASGVGPSGVHELDIGVVDGLPIITVSAQASNSQAAVNLANAAIVGLRNYLDEQAAAGKVPARQRVVVSSFGSAQGAISTRGPRKLYGVVAVVFIFGFLCMLIVTISGIARGWRRAALEESDEPQPGPDAGWPEGSDRVIDPDTLWLPEDLGVRN